MLSAVLAGCGAMSGVWFDAIAKIPSLKLVGLVDLDAGRAEASAKKYNLNGINIGTNLQSVLSSSGPQVVFDVAVPVARKDLVLTAFKNGCHVLTEKPMASSMADARDILEGVKRYGRTHAVVQNRRYLANVRRIRRFLDSGALGKPTSVHCDFFIGPHFGGFREEMDNVLLIDMAIHTFDAARYMVNAAASNVYCREWNPANSWFKAGSSVAAIFELKNSVIFNYRGSWCADGLKTSWESTWRIICERGTLVWDGFEDVRAERAISEREGIFSKTESVEVPPLNKTDRVGGHLGVIEDFVAAIENGLEPETSGTDNIKSLAMVFGAVESAKSGKPIIVPNFEVH